MDTLTYDARGLVEVDGTAPGVAEIHDGSATFDARGLTTRKINAELRRLVYLAERMAEGADLESAMRQSLEELDGVFTYICVTEDALGMAKDELAAKPLVLYEADDLVALASEEIAIRAVVDREIDTYDPFEGEVMVWTR